MVESDATGFVLDALALPFPTGGTPTCARPGWDMVAPAIPVGRLVVAPRAAVAIVGAGEELDEG